MDETGKNPLNISSKRNTMDDVLGEFKASSTAHEDHQILKEKELENYRQRIKELENRVLSLTEENKDINSLLKIALMEKEALEKSLNMNNEQKRSAILQLAEKGLQKVGFGFGFGFIMGDGSSEHSSDDKSGNDELRNEEVVSLASSVERIMNNLRLEISQLRRSLEESRSENERKQRLLDKQAHEIAQLVSYTKELEVKEAMLTQNNEEHHIQLKRYAEEVVRWREACELEAEAGKNILHEHEEMVKILQQELEKTRAALNRSIEKLKIKEELINAVIAAQEAAEKSLQLADSRNAGLCAEIKKLTRYIEELEKRDHTNRRHVVRHVCWPWQALKFNLANNNGRRNGRIKVTVPEMQALLP